jgi:4-amino-4-deoxy-L-arabinose transferase-like glycosyltransferase
MQWQQLKQHRLEIWLVPIILLAFATRIYRLGVQSLWFDEIITVVLARASWYDGLIGLIGQGIQLTPIFHWGIKPVLILGDSEWLLRIPPVIFGVLTIPIMFKLGRCYFNDKIGLVAAFIFAINPYQVWYGQELKLYTLLPLAAAGAMVAFDRLLASHGRRGIWALIVFNALGFTAHYFMFLISTVQFLYLILTFRSSHTILRRWVVTQFVPALCLVPWWLFIIEQQHFAVGIGWIPTPRWFDPLLTFWNFTFTYTDQVSIITIVALVVMVIGLVLGLRQAWQEMERGWLLILWLVLPPLVTFIASFGRISFYMDRYLMIVSPVVTVLIVVGLLSFRARWLSAGLMLFFTISNGLGLLNIYFDRVNFTKNDWRTLAQTIDVQAQVREMVITCTDGYRLAFNYYNPQQTIRADDVINTARLNDENSSAYQTAWVVVRPRIRSVHDLAKTVSPRMDETLLAADAVRWKAQNFEDEIAVAGIWAYRYRLSEPSKLSEVARWYCRN